MGKPFVCVPKWPSADMVDAAEALGARGVRLTLDRTEAQAEYLKWFKLAGLETCLSADTDTFRGVDWNAVRADPENEDLYVPQVSADMTWYAITLRGLIDWLAAWNEWNGVGPESSRLPTVVVNRITQLWRDHFPRPQKLLAASSVSGNPEDLRELELDDVDGVVVHFYATAPDGYPDGMTGRFREKLQAHLDVLPERLKRPGRIHMTEFGYSSRADETDPSTETSELVARQAELVGMACRELFADRQWGLLSLFALHDWRGFGMLRDDGSRKLAHLRYLEATAVAQWVDGEDDQDTEDESEETTVAKYPEGALARYWGSIDPSIPFDIAPAPKGLGICRHWAEDPYKYGPPVSAEESDGNGNMVQLFARRPIRWTPQGPEDLEP